MVFSWLRRCARAVDAYWSVEAELSGLSDHELNDMGLCRSQIPDLADKAAAQAFQA